MTAVLADGTTEILPVAPAEDPPVDCFYLYPTVSSDRGTNSDFVAEEAEEIAAVRNQAARFGQVCQVYAPIYRQLVRNTIAAPADVIAEAQDRAYVDVGQAFEHFLTERGDRPFALIGHAQGATMLKRLLEDEIVGTDLADDLVAAYLLGDVVEVGTDAPGEDLGSGLPLCTADDDTGCVVSYVSYRAPGPGATAVLGRARTEGAVGACTNPGDLSAPTGTAVELEPVFPVSPDPNAPGPFTDPARNAVVTTSFVTYPGLVFGTCTTDGPTSYLAIEYRGDPADPRTDDLGGDPIPAFGLSLVDVNLALGDLVRILGSQIEAFGS